MAELLLVQVEEHEALPDGCSLRFKTQGPGRTVNEVAWESEDGLEGTWRVEAAFPDGSRGPATGYLVDDSSAGTSLLIVGGRHGLRLSLADVTVAEPYLLLKPA